MERTADLQLVAWRARQQHHVQPRAGFLVAALITSACISALFATWLPLQISIFTVFLFAGPQNFFELRYFLIRLPVRFGKSRPFFLTAFTGIGLLTMGYIALPLLYSFGLTRGWAWSNMLAVWNSLLLLWLGALVWMRGKQKLRRDWSWAIRVSFGLISLNWLLDRLFNHS